MNDTPTPRTDDSETRVRKNGFSSLIEYCYANDMAKLECELTTITEQRDRLAKACDRYSEDEILCKLQEVTEQRDRLAMALQQCREDSVELLGERDWWQNETRLDYQKQYYETCDNVTRADEALQSLTPNEL